MSEIDTLRKLERQGFFERARNGDHRACGLFARLAAFTLNPSGDPAGWGCLRKTGGGQNVEGFAEDAIVLGSDPSNRNNVVDIIGGAGAPGASLIFGGFVSRRATDVWERPVPLTAEQMKHLKPNNGPDPDPEPDPDPGPDIRPGRAYPGDEPFNEVGKVLESDYRDAGQQLNAGSATWFARVIWDHAHGGLTIEQSITKHRAEWRAALRLP
jgi:hypothetical protein